MNYLDSVKRRIGLIDNIQGEQLNVIIHNVKDELLALLPVVKQEVPEEIGFIVIEVATKRYNRIGAEGMSSETQDGRSSSYESHDFDEYNGVLNNLFINKKRKASLNFINEL